MDGQPRQGGEQASAAIDQLRMGRRQTLTSLDLQTHALFRCRLAARFSIDVDHAELRVDHVRLIQRKVGEIGRQLFEDSAPARR